MTRESKPLVTIITPVLNRRWSIELCLRSVSAQTYDHIEHIIVDGGSTDGTVDVIESFRSDHELRWISERDQGMYDAVNKGLQLAHGDVVAYVNSDDLYLPWSVEVAIANLEQEHCDLVYGDLGVLTKEARSSFDPMFYFPFDLNYNAHFEALAQPTVFWRRSLSDRLGGFDETFRFIADAEYWLRAAAAGATLEHIDEILAVQLNHPARLTDAYSSQLDEELMRLRGRYREIAGLPRRPRLQAVKMRLRARLRRLQLAASAWTGRGDRWPRFAAFMRERGIHPAAGGLFWYLVPVRMRRGNNPSFCDPGHFERELLALLGARETSIRVPSELD